MFDEDTDFGGHAGTDRLWGIDDLNVGSVFLNVRAPPVTWFGVFVNFEDTSEEFIFDGVYSDLDRHSFSDKADSRFVDFGFDLHPGWVREQEDRLLFADECTWFDDEFATAASGAFVRVDDLAVGRGFDRTRFDLGIDFFEFVLFFDEGVFVRFEFCAGGFDISVVLDQHLCFGQFIENAQSALSRLKGAFCVLDRELFRFDLKWFESSFSGESFGALEGEFGFAKGLLSDGDFA